MLGIFIYSITLFIWHIHRFFSFNAPWTTIKAENLCRLLFYHVWFLLCSSYSYLFRLLRPELIKSLPLKDSMQYSSDVFHKDFIPENGNVYTCNLIFTLIVPQIPCRSICCRKESHWHITIRNCKSGSSSLWSPLLQRYFCLYFGCD